MRKMVDKILAQYGTAMTLDGSRGSVEVRGFLQPVRSKSLQSMVPVMTPLGDFSRGQYIYIGPADVAAAVGETLKLGEKAYTIRRAELYHYDSHPVYLWGLCVEKGSEDVWGNE